jgi:hypothetical protein
MSKKGAGSDSSRVQGKQQVLVYLPDALVAALREDMENEDRGLSATVERALRIYLSDKNPKTAKELRAALEREGLPTT